MHIGGNRGLTRHDLANALCRRTNFLGDEVLRELHGNEEFLEQVLARHHGLEMFVYETRICCSQRQHPRHGTQAERNEHLVVRRHSARQYGNAGEYSVTHDWEDDH